MIYFSKSKIPKMNESRMNFLREVGDESLPWEGFTCDVFIVFDGLFFDCDI